MFFRYYVELTRCSYFLLPRLLHIFVVPSTVLVCCAAFRKLYNLVLFWFLFSSSFVLRFSLHWPTGSLLRKRVNSHRRMHLFTFILRVNCGLIAFSELPEYEECFVSLVFSGYVIILRTMNPWTRSSETFHVSVA